jgi:hypothetical protein
MLVFRAKWAVLPDKTNHQNFGLPTEGGNWPFFSNRAAVGSLS